jgi:flagellar basal-body rod protein FlgC
MNDLAQSASLSSQGMQANSQRLRVVAENLANVDTPGYRRKLLSAQMGTEGFNGAGKVEFGKVHLDKSQLTKVFDPSNPLADSLGYFEGSNVDLIVEVADAREAQRSYEANLKLFDQARQMSRSLLELLKR